MKYDFENTCVRIDRSLTVGPRLCSKMPLQRMIRSVTNHSRVTSTNSLVPGYVLLRLRGAGDRQRRRHRGLLALAHQREVLGQHPRFRRPGIFLVIHAVYGVEAMPPRSIPMSKKKQANHRMISGIVSGRTVKHRELRNVSPDA